VGGEALKKSRFSSRLEEKKGICDCRFAIG
jgi:hypothetical protein